MSEVHVVDKDKVYFHPEQVKYLERVFPTGHFPHNTPHTELVFYNGQQSVVDFVRSRVK